MPTLTVIHVHVLSEVRKGPVDNIVQLQQLTSVSDMTKMFLAARSRWTNRLFSRYIMPEAISAAHSLRVVILGRGYLPSYR